MHIEPISKKEWQEFIIKKFEQRQFQLSMDNYNRIIELSGGHPHFTQYFASVVFDLIRDGVDQNEDSFINLWLSRVIQSQSFFFQEIYDQLTKIKRST
jgi:hypothetical protein